MPYYITVCGNLDQDVPSECKGNGAALCWDNTAYVVQSRTFYYEGMSYYTELQDGFPSGVEDHLPCLFCKSAKLIGSLIGNYLEEQCLGVLVSFLITLKLKETLK